MPYIIYRDYGETEWVKDRECYGPEGENRQDERRVARLNASARVAEARIVEDLSEYPMRTYG